MKFCKPRVHIYQGLSGVETQIHYVIYEDVLKYHGEEFAEQWKKFIKNKSTFDLNNNICYYYIDYKECTYTTTSYLNP